MKLAPYSKYLIENLSPKNDVYLFIGRSAWQKAQAFQVCRPGTLCLPAYEDPSTYIWPVENCDILIFDTSFCDMDYIEDLAQCLFTHNANIVRYVSFEGFLTTYKKEF